MKDRYSARKMITGKVMVTVDGLVGEGQLLDVCVPGCLIETGMPLSNGQYLHLRLAVGVHQIRVALAAVRWINGKKAGVEFIRMSEDDQVKLRWCVGFVAKRFQKKSQWSEPVLCAGLSE